MYTYQEHLNIQAEQEAEYSNDYHSEYWASTVESMKNEGDISEWEDAQAEEANEIAHASHIELRERIIWSDYAQAGWPGTYSEYAAKWAA